jgi:hypothetical protein
MIVKYKVEGEIEIDLDKWDIKDLESYKSETMKKAFLEELFYKKLKSCTYAGYQECDVQVNCENLFIVKDWDKYAGNMKAKNEQYGSPLAITLDKFSTTKEEEINNTMQEIASRKG